MEEPKNILIEITQVHYTKNVKNETVAEGYYPTRITLEELKWLLEKASPKKPQI
jgi:hypothetical protein